MKMKRLVQSFSNYDVLIFILCYSFTPILFTQILPNMIEQCKYDFLASVNVIDLCNAKKINIAFSD